MIAIAAHLIIESKSHLLEIMGGPMMEQQRKSRLSSIVSTWFSTIALGVSVWTATNVYRGEQYRAKFENLSYTQRVYAEYAKDRVARPDLSGCMYVLQDEKAITDKEFVAILGDQPERDADHNFLPLRDFTYDKTRHVDLERCVDTQEIKKLLVGENVELKSEEGNDQTRKLIDAIQIKIDGGLTTLDAALVAYNSPMGDRHLLCENFGGYLTSEAYNPAFGFGIMGRFLSRAIDLHIVRKDNFPNLLNFTQDLSRATAKFTEVLDCSGIRNKSETFPQWVWNMLFGED
jgi:hypothetical protein